MQINTDEKCGYIFSAPLSMLHRLLSLFFNNLKKNFHFGSSLIYLDIILKKSAYPSSMFLLSFCRTGKPSSLNNIRTIQLKPRTSEASNGFIKCRLEYIFNSDSYLIFGKN